ncbi:MAG: hypothetical protein HY904_11110 [Deltaproteobacteria bacterium]|nr:hypothetical protein [Deltaproteobacteria bacterium]
MRRAILLVALGFLASCRAPSAVFRCAADGDCDPGHVCGDGTCRRGCLTNADCWSWQTCTARVCGVRGDVGDAGHLAADAGQPPDLDPGWTPPVGGGDAGGPAADFDPGWTPDPTPGPGTDVNDQDGPASGDAGPPTVEPEVPGEVGRTDGGARPEAGTPDPVGEADGRTDGGGPLRDGGAVDAAGPLDDGRG